MPFSVSLLPAIICTLLGFFALILFFIVRKTRAQRVVITQFSSIGYAGLSLRAKAASIFSYFPHIAFLMLLLAAANPHYTESIPYPFAKEHEGKFLFLLLDQSGSMNTQVLAENEYGRVERVRKMDLSRRLTAQFLQGDPRNGFLGRGGDLIGLIRFARTAQIVLPPTLDKQELAGQVERLDVLRDESGIGTVIGYAIYKALQMIRQTKTALKEEGENAPIIMKDTAVIVVTDGFQETPSEEKEHPFRSISVEEAALEAKTLGVKLYMINIEPAFATEEYVEQRSAYEALCRLTGGEFFMASKEKGLANVYRHLDKLIPSGIEKQQAAFITKKYLGFPLIVAAVYLLLAYLGFFTIFGRRE